MDKADRIWGKLELTQGQFAIVDREDFDWLFKFKWSVHKAPKSYYAMTFPKNKRTEMHRLIMGLKPGDKREIDHINGNGLDNRRGNLRICNRSENQWNAQIRKDNKSGLKGVCFHRHNGGGSWVAKIAYNKKRIHIGSFKTPQEAGEAYDKKALEFHGQFALTNQKMGLL